jgi:hypothetical protein
MAFDDESKSHKRRDLERRQFRLKNLPYSVDESLFDTELSDYDKERGMGRVLREVGRALQGNFDHIGAETERFAKLFNEGQADDHYARETLDPHTHEHGTPSSDSIRSDVLGSNTYVYSYGLGNNTYFSGWFFDGSIILSPIWISENVHVDQIGFEVTSAGGGSGNLYRLRTGIYHADGPGQWPYSLCVDAGEFANPIGVGKHTKTIDVNLRGGQWYWLCGYCRVDTGAFEDTPEVWGWNTTPALNFYGDWGGWWPFPVEEFVRGFMESPTGLEVVVGDPGSRPATLPDPLCDYSIYFDTPVTIIEAPGLFLRVS